MIPDLRPLHRFSRSLSSIWLVDNLAVLDELPIDADWRKHIRQHHTGPKGDIHVQDRLGHLHAIVFLKHGPNADWQYEQARLQGNRLRQRLNEHGTKTVQLLGTGDTLASTLSFAEGMALGNYQFLKYKTKAAEHKNTLREVQIRVKGLTDKDLELLSHSCLATAWARDMVNEPLNALNAVRLAEVIRERCQPAGIHAEVLSKKRIEALKMGGLLAVNKGSIDPPSFIILEYKPLNPMNTHPLVLVGKGVVYDTGGLSLKPSGGMETMKCDMSGAAAVAAATWAAAMNKLPLHIVTLIPATDNRPDGNAYVPGDVITMYTGATVEVLNTDAEGRLILADALGYAQQLDPMLVVNLATLTGAAQRATGKHAMVGMQARARRYMDLMIRAGNHTWERIVEFPLWEEYDEMLKSDIADMKNIGGAEAGAITAGKFLQRFTNYPFIHLDIAGTAFTEKPFQYSGTGGTGSGVRLLTRFLQLLARK